MLGSVHYKKSRCSVCVLCSVVYIIRSQDVVSVFCAQSVHYKKSRCSECVLCSVVYIIRSQDVVSVFCAQECTL